jgi:hypothetical protein
MTWPIFPTAVEIGMAAVFVMLVWAAHERAKVHREWRRLRRELGARDSRLRPWCVAVGAVAGCA